VKAKTQTINQLRGILVSAPQDIRDRFLRPNAEDCVNMCSKVRSLRAKPLRQSLLATLRLLAKRRLALKAEVKVLDAELEQLTCQHASRLRWVCRALNDQRRDCAVNVS